MKKIIRRGVFESNSSSTHSISISRKTDSNIGRFPRNSTDAFVLGDGAYDDYCCTEISKANFILNAIAQFLDNPGKASLTFEDFVELNQIVWLKEVIKKETGTKICLNSYYSYFPYYEGVYDTDYDIEEIFKFNWFSKSEFMNGMKDIIFNDDITISYSVEEY